MRRLLRAIRLLLRDGRVPRPVRWVAGFAVLPVPGPFDEAVLLLVAPFLWLFHRESLRDAWRAAARA